MNSKEIDKLIKYFNINGDIPSERLSELLVFLMGTNKDIKNLGLYAEYLKFKNFVKNQKIHINPPKQLSYSRSCLVQSIFNQETPNKNIVISKCGIIDLKFDTSINCLPDKYFKIILDSIRTIAENFCDCFEFPIENLEIGVLKAEPGCFNITLNVNISGNNVNLNYSDSSKYNLIETIVTAFTGKSLEENAGNICGLIKDCVIAYMTKPIPNNELKYIDTAKSKKAKRNFYKTCQSLPDFKWVSFNNKKVKKSNIDYII